MYVHNHVLRAIINNTWGENLKSSNNYIANEEINLSYSISISSLEQFNINHSTNELFMGNGNTGAWDTNKLNIVAVDIRDISDQGIRQRIVDFITGIAFISDSKMRIIHKDGVYLVMPSNMSLPSTERERLQTLGLYKINV